jgi:hypothetical protein
VRWYLLLAFVSAATPVSAQEATAGSDVDSPTKVEEQSRHAFEAGQAAYERREFGLTAAEFQRAYALLPSPVLLYDLAQAERLAGRCGAALAHYRQFAAEHVGPLPADIEDKIVEVEHCSAAIPAESSAGSSRATPRFPEPPPVQVSRPAPAPVPAPGPPLPAWVGWTAASVGAAALVAGTVMAVMVADRKAVVERTCLVARRAKGAAERRHILRTANEP